MIDIHISNAIVLTYIVLGNFMANYKQDETIAR